MRRCTECAVDIEGAWNRCPLCGTSLSGPATANPFPAIPLRFSRRRILRVLFLASILVILGSFLAQLLFTRDSTDIGLIRSAWLGVSAMWLVVVMAVRKRRNVAKSTVYLVILVALVCVYWDYLTGWHGWSVTYAVPIVCASSIVAVLIAVWAMRMEVGDHIVYSALTVLLGLAPIMFLFFEWVTNPLPSAVCGVLSIVSLAVLYLTRGPEIRHELGKRLHL